MRKIILASKSERRKELLEKLGVVFEAEESKIVEKIDSESNPEELVGRLSKEKAEDIGRKHINDDILIIGADTIVVCDGKILGKPKSKEEAKRMLKILSGTVHQVFTGFTILDTKKWRSLTHVEATKVYMRRFKNWEIEQYVASGEPIDKAGGYAIQGRAALFVKKIEGDFFNVVGLPLYSFGLKLREFGVEI